MQPSLNPTQSLIQLIQYTLSSKKAENINTVSLIGKTDIADAMMVATGSSTRHAAALARYVCDALTASGHAINGIDGLQMAKWVVIDAGDVMIHIFTQEMREKYQLEKMWQMTFTPENDQNVSAA